MAGFQIPLSEEWGVFVEKAVRERGYAGAADVVEQALAELAANEAEDAAVPVSDEVRRKVFLGRAQIERGECSSYELSEDGRLAFLEAARAGGRAILERRRSAATEK